MKLIIDVSKEAYKRCCVIADLDGSPILKAIKNGTPLDDIKAEINERLWEDDAERVFEIIDKHMVESEDKE